MAYKSGTPEFITISGIKALDPAGLIKFQDPAGSQGMALEVGEEYAVLHGGTPTGDAVIYVAVSGIVKALVDNNGLDIQDDEISIKRGLMLATSASVGGLGGFSETLQVNSSAQTFGVIVNATGGAGDYTIFLPTVSGVSNPYNGGKTFWFKRMNAGSVNTVIDPFGTETIDGAFTKTLGSQYASLMIMARDQEWVIISQMGTIT